MTTFCHIHTSLATVAANWLIKSVHSNKDSTQTAVNIFKWKVFFTLSYNFIQ